MTLQHINGIILKHNSLFESDIRIELLTPKLGKLTCLAKGMKKSASKGRSAIDAFHVIRGLSDVSRSFPYLVQIDLVEAFTNIRTEFNRISMAAYFTTIIYRATITSQPNEELYTLLYEGLTRLNSLNTPIGPTKTWYQNTFLKIEGVLEPQQSISDTQFLKNYYDYCHHTLQAPLLMTP
jgi:DNA repair protein RecO (recombination protein O)